MGYRQESKVVLWMISMSLKGLRYGVLGLAIALLVPLSPAWAAETVVLKFLIFRESIAVSELSTFAETGELSPALRAYMAMSKQDPQAVQSVLTRQVPVNLIVMDRVLNSPVGDVVLDRLSEAIHTPSNQANRQALRSALVLSASDDNRISLIEVIENYPTQEVHVEGDRLLEAYNQLSRLTGRVQDILKILRLP